MSQHDNESHEKVAEDVKEFSDFDLAAQYKEQTGEDVPAIVDEMAAEFQTIDVDFDTARKNILSVVKNGDDVLKEIILLAKSTDHPRAWEVVATLMKTITDANKELVDLHRQRVEIRNKERGTANQEIKAEDNTLFVGTTAELEKFLLQQKLNVLEHDDDSCDINRTE